MAPGGVGWRLLDVVVGQPPLILAPPCFLPDRVRLGVPILPVQGASELTCTTMHGFCYQLIRVEASGSRDQAVALVRRPLPSRAGLHPGRGRDGEPRYPLVC